MTFEEVRGLVIQAAKRQFGRLNHCRVDVDFEELMQEGTEVFLRCKRGFDETRGFKFTTYLVSSLTNHFNSQYARTIQRLHFEGHIDELDEVESIESPDWLGNPEMLVMKEQEIQESLNSLSTDARLLVESVTCSLDSFNRRYGTSLACNANFRHVKGVLIERGSLSHDRYYKAKRELLSRVE